MKRFRAIDVFAKSQLALRFLYLFSFFFFWVTPPESMEATSLVPSPSFVPGGEILETGVFLCHAGFSFSIANSIYSQLIASGINTFLDVYSFVPGLCNVLRLIPEIASPSRLALYNFLSLTQAAIVILSEEVYRSEWCMFELRTIVAIVTARHTFPLVVINDPANRAKPCPKDEAIVKKVRELARHSISFCYDDAAQLESSVADLAKILFSLGVERTIWKCPTVKCNLNAVLIREYHSTNNTWSCKFSLLCPNHHQELFHVWHNSWKVESFVRHNDRIFSSLVPTRMTLTRGLSSSLKTAKKYVHSYSPLPTEPLHSHDSLASFLFLAFTMPPGETCCVSSFVLAHEQELYVAWKELDRVIADLHQGIFKTTSQFLTQLRASFPGTADAKVSAEIHTLFDMLLFGNSSAVNIDKVKDMLRYASPANPEMFQATLSTARLQQAQFDQFTHDFAIVASPTSTDIALFLEAQLCEAGYSLLDRRRSSCSPLSSLRNVIPRARCLVIIVDQSFRDTGLASVLPPQVPWQIVIPVFFASLDTNSWVYDQYQALCELPGVDFNGKGFKNETKHDFQHRALDYILRLTVTDRKFFAHPTLSICFCNF